MNNKVLHVALIAPGGYNENAWKQGFLENGFEYHFFDWQQIRYSSGIESMRSQLVDKAKELKPGLIWIHIQSEGILDLLTMKILSGIGYTVLYNFDVRDKERTEWMYQLTPLAGLACYACAEDVLECESRGYKNAMVLQSSCDMDWYKKLPWRLDLKSRIVFIGLNNVGNKTLNFPLSQERYDMVKMLHTHYRDSFSVVGMNWNDFDVNELANPQKEIQLYNECDIAISHNQYDCELYTSDRLWRIMACGAFCLTKYFKGIETDFVQGVHLDWWHTIEELKEKVAYYLNNEDIRKKMAVAGMDHVRAIHTWGYRIKHAIQKKLSMQDSTGCGEAHVVEGIIPHDHMVEYDGRVCDCKKILFEKYECGGCSGAIIVWKLRAIQNPNY